MIKIINNKNTLLYESKSVFSGLYLNNIFLDVKYSILYFLVYVNFFNLFSRKKYLLTKSVLSEDELTFNIFYFIIHPSFYEEISKKGGSYTMRNLLELLELILIYYIVKQLSK